MTDRCCGPTSPWILVLLGCVALAAGCVSNPGSNSGAPCPDKPCASGQVCANNTCHKVCHSNNDCSAGFGCNLDGGYCVRVNVSGGDGPQGGDPAGACDPPTANVSLTGSGTVYAGLPVAATGVATTNDATLCPTTTSWWICNAPATSKYFTSAGDGCTKLNDGDTSSVTLDKGGNYTLEYRVLSPGGSDQKSTTVTAKTDAVFVRLKFTDPTLYKNIVAIMNSCSSYNGNQTLCQAGAYSNFCTWSGSGSTGTCAPTFDQRILTCAASPTASDCAANGADCAWRADGGLCRPNCSDLSQTDCPKNLCTWNNGTCEDDMSDYLWPAASVAELRSDGEQLAPVAFDVAATQYRFNPNSAPVTTSIPGTGLDPGTSGISFSTAADTAAIPVAYLVKGPSGACSISTAILLWQGSDQGGVPASAPVALSSVRGPFSGSTTSFTEDTVGYPAMQADGAGGWRTFYGLTHGNNTTFDTCDPGQGPGGYDYEFDLMTALAATGLGPLTMQTPMPLWLAHSTGGTVTTIPLHAGGTAATAYPCNYDRDCPGSGDTCDGTSHTCSGSFDVEGYLPRPLSSGSAVLFSHVACGDTTTGSYGSACSGDSSSSYDLVLAGVDEQASAAMLTNPTFVAADPSVNEMDGLIAGDPMGASSELIYLGLKESTSTTLTVNRDCSALSQSECTNASSVCTWNGGTCGPNASSTSPTSETITPSVPQYVILSRNLSHSSSGWQVTPLAGSAATDVLAQGSQQLITGTTISCNIDHLNAYDSIQNTVQFTNPVQFTLSPDGRYLAYAWVTQQLACQTYSCPTGSGCDDSFQPGQPVKSDVRILDLQTPGTPYSIKSTCTGVGPNNLMPYFLANGQQLAFTSTLGGVSNVMRVNLADILAGTCDSLTNLAPLNAATTALQQVNPGLQAQSMDLEGSRTFIEPACSSEGPLLGWLGALVVGLAGLGWVRRSKKRRR